MELSTKIKFLRALTFVSMLLSFPFLYIYGFFLSAIAFYGLNKKSYKLFKVIYIIFIFQAIIYSIGFIENLSSLIVQRVMVHEDTNQTYDDTYDTSYVLLGYYGIQSVITILLTINFYKLSKNPIELMEYNLNDNDLLGQSVDSEALPAYTPEANPLPPYTPPAPNSNFQMPMVNNSMNNSSILPYPPPQNGTNNNPTTYPPQNQSLNIPINNNVPYPPPNSNMPGSRDIASPNFSPNNPFVPYPPPPSSSTMTMPVNNNNATTTNAITNNISPYPQNDDASIIIMPTMEVPYLPSVENSTEHLLPNNISTLNNTSNLQVNTNADIQSSTINNISSIAPNDDQYMTTVDITTILPSSLTSEETPNTPQDNNDDTTNNNNNNNNNRNSNSSNNTNTNTNNNNNNNNNNDNNNNNNNNNNENGVIPPPSSPPPYSLY